MAKSRIAQFPIKKFKMSELSENEVEEIKLILSAFQHKFIPEMLIDVKLIKAMLDRKEAALSSRFSVP